MDMRSPPVSGYELRDQSVGFANLGGVAAGDDCRFLIRRIIGVAVGADADAHPFAGDLGMELGPVDVLAPARHLDATIVARGEHDAAARHVAHRLGVARVPVKDLWHVGGQGVGGGLGREGHARGLKVLAVSLDELAAERFDDRLEAEADPEGRDVLFHETFAERKDAAFHYLVFAALAVLVLPEPEGGAGDDHSGIPREVKACGVDGVFVDEGDRLDAAVRVEAAPVDDGFELVVRDGAGHSADRQQEGLRGLDDARRIGHSVSLDGRHQNGEKRLLDEKESKI